MKKNFRKLFIILTNIFKTKNYVFVSWHLGSVLVYVGGREPVKWTGLMSKKHGKKWAYVLNAYKSYADRLRINKTNDSEKVTALRSEVLHNHHMVVLIQYCVPVL